MSMEVHKIRPEHLRRDAYLYIRQSTLRQVIENTESTQRQYALRDRAVALGWPRERVIVIDADLGQSGADADREGFQRLVADVGMCRAGIVMGLEVSRLARNSSDWHRLLEICALTQTLILDEDGLYDPQQFNDRLLLGLKGTMSEAELHLLRSRLRGGLLNKARRGELRTPMPIGLVHDSQRGILFDPDQQIRGAIAQLFRSFRESGSALAVVKQFGREGWLFPRRLRAGPRAGEVVWGELGHSRVLHVLHNPRYAGAYFYGRHRVYKSSEGNIHNRRLPQDQWPVLLIDAFPGYISWEEFQKNERLLKENARSHGEDRRHGPAGSGCALLQGLVVCGRCGRRMTVRYYHREGHLVPWYNCQTECTEKGKAVCQSLPGQNLDAAVAELLLDRLAPAALEMTLAVQKELEARGQEADQLRRQQVERARYEAEQARRRFVHVDPANRLVADTLETEWNDKLRALRDAEEQYEQFRQRAQAVLDEETRAAVLLLSTDFPKLWNDPKTTDQDRKRMARLLLDDVTLGRSEKRQTASVRFKGGTCHALELDRPKNAWEMRQTKPDVVRRIDELLEEYTEGEIAARLNAEGLKPGNGGPFTSRHVQHVRRAYGLKSRYERLRAAGFRTVEEIAEELRVTRNTVNVWKRHGLLRARNYSDKGESLFEPLGPDRPRKQQGQKLAERAQK